MSRSEKKLMREARYKHKNNNPSFSSSLLDQICRSIDDNDGVSAAAKHEESLRFRKGTLQKKACLVDKRMENNKVSEKKTAVDGIFFSSSSSSSDSSYVAGFSSSDTEYGSKTKAPCFVPWRPKPVGTGTKPLFTEQRQFHSVGGHAKKSSRGVKIYGDLKKMKQPISPGARIASFINSLFSTVNNNNTKKTKNPTTTIRYDDEVSTTCSSARRPYLSNNSHSAKGQGSRMLPVSASTLRYDDDQVSMTFSSASAREKSRKEVRKSVRFCPVDLDSRPCGRKCVYEEQGPRLRPVSVPNARKMASRESEDEDDDVASDSSSDLFELDHLLMGNYDEYRDQELPVYETTHVETNRAIANGLLAVMTKRVG